MKNTRTQQQRSNLKEQCQCLWQWMSVMSSFFIEQNSMRVYFLMKISRKNTNDYTMCSHRQQHTHTSLRSLQFHIVRDATTLIWYRTKGKNNRCIFKLKRSSLLEWHIYVVVYACNELSLDCGCHAKFMTRVRNECCCNHFDRSCGKFGKEEGKIFFSTFELKIIDNIFSIFRQLP